MFYDVAMNFVIGTILMVAGAIMIWIPNRIFTGILIASIAFLCVNGVVLFIRFIKNKMNKDFFFYGLSVYMYCAAHSIIDGRQKVQDGLWHLQRQIQ